VPGVTAGVAAPAYAGISVTHRDYASAVAFITGHEDPAKGDSQLDWPVLATFPGTLVFYMGVRQLPRLSESLMNHGMSGDTPAAAIEWGTTPRQRTVAGPLREIASRVDQSGLRPPAVIVVGRVANIPGNLNWFEARPLFGKRIVVTRPLGQALSTVDRLTQFGAEVLELPALRIEPIADWSNMDHAIAELTRYDWVVFTSANGVQSFLGRVAELGRDARVFGHARIAAIGPATADELKRHQLRADLVPEEANSESLVAAIPATSATGQVLLVRADQGRDVLPAGLRAAGIPFDEIVAYRVVDETHWDERVISGLERAEVDWITVTSPRIVRALDSGLSTQAKAQLGAKVKVASISPLTSEAARAKGWIPTVEASEANIDALIEAIVGWEAGGNR
jgi:uroporphyrinogen III methyltransferase / synthase